MIDQVCSMALTYAHSDGREYFEREDLVEAMTTVEAGVAIGQPYPKHEERATAIHEAGHAVCGHLFMENRMSTRLSIRKRGSSGGHHQAMEIEDRFGHWRSEQVGDLIWGLGAMAAEHVFYGQNTTGVGGDVGMVDRPRRAHGRLPRDGARRRSTSTTASPTASAREEEEERVMERFEKIGTQIMQRSGGGMMDGNPYSATLADGGEAHARGAALLGQAFVVAYNTIKKNHDGHRLHRQPADVRRRALRRRRDAAARGRAAREARDRRARRGHMAKDLIPPPSPAGRPSGRCRGRAPARPRARGGQAPPGRAVEPHDRAGSRSPTRWR